MAVGRFRLGSDIRLADLPAPERSLMVRAETAQVRPGRIGRARLLKRVFDIDMQRYPNFSGVELRIIAAIVGRPAIEKILAHLGLDPQPPPKGGARKAGKDFAA